MTKKNETVAYLDGIRGVAAFLVFVHHFLLAFYISFYNWDPAASHLSGLEISYGKSVLSVFSSGNFCVHIFFVLSGFVLSRKYFSTNAVEVAVSRLHRRFVRLYIPVAFTLITAYVLLKAGWYLNKPVSSIAHSEWWFAGLWDIPHPTLRLISGLVYSTMFQADNIFDTSMWTLSIEFYGSLFVFAFLVFTHYTKYRPLMFCLALFYFYNAHLPYYASFVAGISLCYVERRIIQNARWYNNLIALACVALALVLGSYPSGGSIKGTLFDHLGHTLLEYSEWFRTVGAYLLVFAFVIARPLQKLISVRPFRFLGRISFSLYLIHPLLIGTVSCWVFLHLYNGVNYNYAAAVTFGATVVAMVTVSWLMARYVDEFGIHLAKGIYDRIRKKGGDPRHQPTAVVREEEVQEA